MTADRRRRIEEIYEAVLQRPPAERRAFLETACAGDATLGDEVERLVLAQERAGNFLMSPAWEVAASALASTVGTEMRLVGRRIGQYEIVEALGAGGMGEVYRARDTRLNRDVALKVLPDVFARDEDRVARFRREAHVLASLNHSNIAAIHGFEDAGETKALVLELVEGPTLADRITHGALPLDEALPIARQIAEALEAAHERGIIHRDLKPANIKVRADGVVKVLDFGLAKVLEAAAPDADLTKSPTVYSPVATHAGLILGTAGYMAPEQARGKPADKRADMWSFGCVLYEMLTGIRPFSGTDVPETLAAILTREPDWAALPDRTPVSIRRLLRRCLTKDLKGRVADASIARIEIDEALSGTVEISNVKVGSQRRERFVWASALIIVTAIAVGAIVWALRPAPVAREVHVEISTPPTVWPFSFAISPDGQKILFEATSDGQSKLWVRSLETGVATPLAETNDAMFGFWSPDSQSVAFFTQNTLRRTDIDGRSLQELAKIPGVGGTWSQHGVILFSGFSGIFRVPATGGEPTAVTHGLLHLNPQFLPDGRHFVYHVPEPAPAGLYVGHVDGSSPRRLLDADVNAGFISGRLLFVRQGVLYAQSFNPARLELSGSPVRVADNVEWIAGFPAAVSASQTGTLIYRKPSPGILNSLRRLIWYDRSGNEVERVGDPERGLGNPELSPDGKHLAFLRGVPPDITLLTLDRVVRSRHLTANRSVNLNPVWSPDSKRVIFSSNQKGPWDLYQNSVDGDGPEQLFYKTPPGSDGSFAADWSRDGRFLLYGTNNPETRVDVWAITIEQHPKPFAVVQSRFDDFHAQFSPDGEWIAYQSNETGRWEIYLQAFPSGGKQTVSTHGGADARWRRDGKELFYVALDGQLMAVAIAWGPDGKPAIGEPKPLFKTNPGGFVPSMNRQQYMVSPDGARFLMNTIVEPAAIAPLDVIFNWKPKP